MKQRWKKHAGKMAGVLVLLILAGFGLTYWREIWAVLTRPQARDAFIEFVRGKGVPGVFIFRWWWLSCPVKRLNSLRAFFTAPGPGCCCAFWAFCWQAAPYMLSCACSAPNALTKRLSPNTVFFGMKRTSAFRCSWCFSFRARRKTFSLIWGLSFPFRPGNFSSSLRWPAFRRCSPVPLPQASWPRARGRCRLPCLPSQGLWPFCAWRLKNTSSPGSGGGTQKNNGKLSCNMLY